MAIVATGQATVLQAVVDRLIAQVTSPVLTESTCFVCLDPDTEIPQRSSNLYVTVSPMDSQFDQPAIEGGGNVNSIEQSGVTVTMRSAIKLDKAGSASDALMHASRGLLLVKRQVLKALVGQQLQDGSGNDLLTSLIAPLNGDRGRYDEENMIFRLSVSFALDYEWDLIS